MFILVLIEKKISAKNTWHALKSNNVTLANICRILKYKLLMDSLSLTLSWRRTLSYRNQINGLVSIWYNLSLSLSVSLCLSLCLSVSLSVSPSLCLSLSLYLSLSHCLSVSLCLSVYLCVSVCLCVSLSLSVSLCLSLCFSLSLSLSLPLCLKILLFSFQNTNQTSGFLKKKRENFNLTRIVSNVRVWLKQL